MECAVIFSKFWDNFLLEPHTNCLFPGLAQEVFVIIAVFPLSISKAHHAFGDGCKPFGWRFGAASRVIVALLEVSPFLGGKTFNPALPANGGLCLKSTDDIRVILSPVERGGCLPCRRVVPGVPSHKKGHPALSTGLM